MVSHQSLTVLLTPGCQRIICCNLSGLHNLTSDYPFLIVYSVTDTLPQGCDQLCSGMQCGRGIMIYWTLRERVKHFYSYLTLVTGQWTGSVRSQSGQRQGGHNPELAASMEGSQQDPVSVKVEIRTSIVQKSTPPWHNNHAYGFAVILQLSISTNQRTLS